MARKRPRSNRVEAVMARNLDNLAKYEAFTDEVLPELRKMLAEGKSADEIYKFATSLAAARAVTIAVSERDSSKALTAVKEILDRSSGKAVERAEVSHKMDGLTDEQLDAMLISKLKKAKVGDEDTKETDDADADLH